LPCHPSTQGHQVIQAPPPKGALLNSPTRLSSFKPLLSSIGLSPRLIVYPLSCSSLTYNAYPYPLSYSLGLPIMSQGREKNFTIHTLFTTKAEAFSQYILTLLVSSLAKLSRKFSLSNWLGLGIISQRPTQWSGTQDEARVNGRGVIPSRI
jgi:hypothetical protein